MEESGGIESEKSLKKQAQKAEKEARKAEKAAALEAQQQAASAALNKQVDSIENDTYGILPLCNSSQRTDRQWTGIKDITQATTNIWVRGRIHESRCKGSLGFLVLRNQSYTIQVVLANDKPMIKFAASLPVESIVDIFADVTKPDQEITGATQQVELQAKKIFCVSKATNELPFQLRDANQAEGGEKGEQEGVIRVTQETRLDNRVLDLRTLANQAILRVSSQVCELYREALLKEGFVEIHTPKLIGGTSEGGSNVFKLDYFSQKACLAQSPQLYKQMAICADLDRVFEIGPVFRAENSNTHRHLCEFTGLDLEMSIKEHYFEALELVEKLFLHIFRGLKERCAAEIATVHRQYPSTPFQVNEKVLRIDFEEGVEMLRQANVADVPPREDISNFDLNTEQEKALGQLVKQKYQTDFYYMINYPLAVRPFYTMPAAHNPKLSNSYDFFMRGEEILSGAQRIHDPVFLTQRAKACGIDTATIKDYINSFLLGAYPHAGIGIGLERVVMLYLGLNNIRKTSMFPRDPKRLTP